MIRRNPTLITMSDSDVQDVRSMLARKKTEAVSSATNGKGKGKDVSQQSTTPFVAAEEAKRKREAMTREERLGI
ncbi:hypothetical protein EW146_g5293 [Bondarzewia mesenterica]|uniref:Uncharacterized protein n=1 Tax=Bondarzewia mesenterica TaxID=1095465 RepID=A0A4S4LRW4_9AGAM|nr:hypothetical protein EW146_g5293 [Bondarzewia mesenterica]